MAKADQPPTVLRPFLPPPRHHHHPPSVPHPPPLPPPLPPAAAACLPRHASSFVLLPRLARCPPPHPRFLCPQSSLLTTHLPYPPPPNPSYPASSWASHPRQEPESVIVAAGCFRRGRPALALTLRHWGEAVGGGRRFRRAGGWAQHRCALES
eukprot:854043-Pyramimonas_sp.AAC.1